MKRLLFLTVLMMFALGLSAQNYGESKSSSFNFTKEVKPPILDFVNGTLHFDEVSGNKALDANENANITFHVTNSGSGDARNCKAILKANGETAGLLFDESTVIPTIKVGETATVTLPITTNRNTKDGEVEFSVSVTEPNGFGISPHTLSVTTYKFLAPMVEIVDYTVTAKNTGVLAKKEPFDLQLLLQNTEQGTAEEVNVEVVLPEGTFVLEGDKKQSFSILHPGSSKSIEMTLIINNDYSLNDFPVEVKIEEKYGSYSLDKTFTLSLNQPLASGKITVEAEAREFANISRASLTSPVDKNIPITSASQPYTFAVIIANENYNTEAMVPFALNDGIIFAEYCEKTLGIPSENIHFRQNVTLNQMRNEISWLQRVIEAHKNEKDCKVVFYYAGHGIPNESTQSAALLPIDGSGNNIETGYLLQNLYTILSALPSQQTLVLLDACFSGTKRDGNMLAQNGRGIAIKIKQDDVSGNMVVFSASQNDETAYPYTKYQHGMFTYFLLEKLQTTEGAVTLKELEEYVSTQVKRSSIIHNNKSQSPKLTPSRILGTNWETWQL